MRNKLNYNSDRRRHAKNRTQPSIATMEEERKNIDRIVICVSSVGTLWSKQKKSDTSQLREMRRAKKKNNNNSTYTELTNEQIRDKSNDAAVAVAVAVVLIAEDFPCLL